MPRSCDRELDEFVHPMEESINLLLDHAKALWDENNYTREDMEKLRKVIEQMEAIKRNDRFNTANIIDRVQKAIVFAMRKARA